MMLDNQKISIFIASKRKQLGMTQADMAKKLNVSFQAVSKWENGTLPTVEILADLAKILNLSVDEILMGQDRNCETFSYSRAGIEGNLSRIIPDGLCAEIDLAKIKTLPLFRYIKKMGNIDEREMLSTFNCGVGLCIVADKDAAGQVASQVSKYHDCYGIGKIKAGDRKIAFKNHLVSIKCF